MFFWLALVIIVLFLGGLVTYIKLDIKTRNILIFIISVLLIWFSAFRDGLGTDYYVYVHRLLYAPVLDIPILLSEPLFNIFIHIIRDTYLTEIFYFLMMAIITIFPAILIYKKFNNIFIILLVFIMLPILYFGSFNIVRQLAAASIFLYSSKFIIDRQFIKYILFILIAFFLHKSALLLIPIYFINLKEIRIPFVIVLFGLSFTPTIFYDLAVSITAYLELISYDNYINYSSDAASSISFTQVLFHIILFILLLLKESIKKMAFSEYYILSIKMSILYLFFINLSVSGLSISYRLAFYFALFLPILPIILIEYFNKSINKILVTVIIIIIFSFIGGRFLYINIDNDYVIPSKIKSLNSLID
jgi:transmembrane protein EpsG